MLENSCLFIIYLKCIVTYQLPTFTAIDIWALWWLTAWTTSNIAINHDKCCSCSILYFSLDTTLNIESDQI